jgi:hypothetical protein
MKRPHRSNDGMYHINGKKYRELFGSRQQVVNGTAYKTAGELVKSDLIMNKWGRIVSKKKHATAKKEKRLLKHGYTAKKGKFGYVKVNSRKSRKMRGGNQQENQQQEKQQEEKQQNLQGGNQQEEEKQQNQEKQQQQEEKQQNLQGGNQQENQQNQQQQQDDKQQEKQE